MSLPHWMASEKKHYLFGGVFFPSEKWGCDLFVLCHLEKHANVTQGNRCECFGNWHSLHVQSAIGWNLLMVLPWMDLLIHLDCPKPIDSECHCLLSLLWAVKTTGESADGNSRGSWWGLLFHLWPHKSLLDTLDSTLGAQETTIVGCKGSATWVGAPGKMLWPCWRGGSRADRPQRGHCCCFAVAAAATAGNPGQGPQLRSLQAWGSGSCGVTYKFSLAFVCLTVSSQRPLPPAPTCGDLLWVKPEARHTQYTLINATETALGMAENRQQWGAGKIQHPLTSNSLCIDWQAKPSKDTLFIAQI